MISDARGTTESGRLWERGRKNASDIDKLSRDLDRTKKELTHDNINFPSRNGWETSLPRRMADTCQARRQVAFEK
jgi:hypothetical protein